MIVPRKMMRSGLMSMDVDGPCAARPGRGNDDLA
jgi:hypothetical protein